MASRIFGEIPGHPPGTIYADRREASAAGVHRPLQGGICGGADGAESVVVSGGYVDDLDYGDEIIYTGHGGRDPDTGLQIADQELARGNLGLARNYLDDIPVRVIRGHQGVQSISPPAGYRYDGLFRVANFWQEVGKDGFRIWRFRLKALDELSAMPAPVRAARPSLSDQRHMTLSAKRRTSSEYLGPRREIRDIHDYRCQVCGLRLETPAGPHALAVYIRPLTAPHHGASSIDNLLCLCPNDAIRFATGGIYINEASSVIDSLGAQSIGPLRMDPAHTISLDHLRYHREQIAGKR